MSAALSPSSVSRQYDQQFEGAADAFVTKGDKAAASFLRQRYCHDGIHFLYPFIQSNMPNGETISSESNNHDSCSSRSGFASVLWPCVASQLDRIMVAFTDGNAELFRVSSLRLYTASILLVEWCRTHLCSQVSNAYTDTITSMLSSAPLGTGPSAVVSTVIILNSPVFIGLNNILTMYIGRTLITVEGLVAQCSSNIDTSRRALLNPIRMQLTQAAAGVILLTKMLEQSAQTTPQCEAITNSDCSAASYKVSSDFGSTIIGGVLDVWRALGQEVSTFTTSTNVSTRLYAATCDVRVSLRGISSTLELITDKRFSLSAISRARLRIAILTGMIVSSQSLPPVSLIQVILEVAEKGLSNLHSVSIELRQCTSVNLKTGHQQSGIILPQVEVDNEVRKIRFEFLNEVVNCFNIVFSVLIESAVVRHNNNSGHLTYSNCWPAQFWQQLRGSQFWTECRRAISSTGSAEHVNYPESINQLLFVLRQHVVTLCTNILEVVSCTGSLMLFDYNWNEEGNRSDGLDNIVNNDSNLVVSGNMVEPVVDQTDLATAFTHVCCDILEEVELPQSPTASNDNNSNMCNNPPTSTYITDFITVLRSLCEVIVPFISTISYRSVEPADCGGREGCHSNASRYQAQHRLQGVLYRVLVRAVELLPSSTQQGISPPRNRSSIETDTILNIIACINLILQALAPPPVPQMDPDDDPEDFQMVIEGLEEESSEKEDIIRYLGGFLSVCVEKIGGILAHELSGLLLDSTTTPGPIETLLQYLKSVGFRDEGDALLYGCYYDDVSVAAFVTLSRLSELNIHRTTTDSWGGSSSSAATVVCQDLQHAFSTILSALPQQYLAVASENRGIDVARDCSSSVAMGTTVFQAVLHVACKGFTVTSVVPSSPIALHEGTVLSNACLTSSNFSEATLPNNGDVLARLISRCHPQGLGGDHYLTGRSMKMIITTSSTNSSTPGIIWHRMNNGYRALEILISTFEVGALFSSGDYINSNRASAERRRCYSAAKEIVGLRCASVISLALGCLGFTSGGCHHEGYAEEDVRCFHEAVDLFLIDLFQAMVKLIKVSVSSATRLENEDLELYFIDIVLYLRVLGYFLSFISKDCLIAAEEDSTSKRHFLRFPQLRATVALSLLTADPIGMSDQYRPEDTWIAKLLILSLSSLVTPSSIHLQTPDTSIIIEAALGIAYLVQQSPLLDVSKVPTGTASALSYLSNFICRTVHEIHRQVHQLHLQRHMVVGTTIFTGWLAVGCVCSAHGGAVSPTPVDTVDATVLQLLGELLLPLLSYSVIHNESRDRYSCSLSLLEGISHIVGCTQKSLGRKMSSSSSSQCTNSQSSPMLAQFIVHLLGSLLVEINKNSLVFRSLDRLRVSLQPIIVQCNMSVCDAIVGELLLYQCTSSLSSVSSVTTSLHVYLISLEGFTSFMQQPVLSDPVCAGNTFQNHLLVDIIQNFFRTSTNHYSPSVGKEIVSHISIIVSLFSSLPDHPLSNEVHLLIGKLVGAIEWYLNALCSSVVLPNDYDILSTCYEAVEWLPTLTAMEAMVSFTAEIVSSESVVMSLHIPRLVTGCLQSLTAFSPVISRISRQVNSRGAVIDDITNGASHTEEYQMFEDVTWKICVGLGKLILGLSSQECNYSKVGTAFLIPMLELLFTRVSGSISRSGSTIPTLSRDGVRRVTLGRDVIDVANGLKQLLVAN